MANQWPEGVNNKIWNVFERPPVYPVVRDTMDVGTPKVRLRSTTSEKIHEWDMAFTRKEYETFAAWVGANLVGGTQPFQIAWPDALGGGAKTLRLEFDEGEPTFTKKLSIEHKNVVIVSIVAREVADNG
jgi:hypothetical protein